MPVNSSIESAQRTDRLQHKGAAGVPPLAAPEESLDATQKLTPAENTAVGISAG